MSIHVQFPGSRRVDAVCGDFVVRTDQPVEHGGEGSAPEPFTLFLASLATCAGYYVLAYCDARGIPTKDVRVELEHTTQDTGRLSSVRLCIELPSTFPARYVDGVRRAAESCKVKKTLLDPPSIHVLARVREDDLRPSVTPMQGASPAPEPSPKTSG